MLAAELGVASPSVTAMIKRLQDGEFVDRAGRRELRLTESGELAALRVVRRHRLLETFLNQMLGMPWHEVHSEAELLEHVLSDRLEERIDAALGHPTHDPHGDPIPPRHGPHDERWGVGLDAVPPGAFFRVRRVSDRDSAALRHLGELGVRPGVVLAVERQDPFGGPLWVRIDDRSCALGTPLTRLVHGDVLERGENMTATDPSPPTISEIRQRGGVRGTLTFLGPAFVAAIAYVDPGNFATNFSAGANYGFLLLWVIVAANLIAMLIQTLTAKLGMATGRDLPEMCRDTFPRPVSRLMWVQAELVAIATDLAEVIGGAIALNLLFGIPLFTGGVITGVVAFALLALQRRGYRPVRAGHRRAARRHRCSGSSRPCCGSTCPRARSPKASSPASTAPRACCWPPASSAPP